MQQNELKDWLEHMKKELNKIKLPIYSVYYGLIQGALLMIDLTLKKMEK